MDLAEFHDTYLAICDFVGCPRGLSFARLVIPACPIGFLSVDGPPYRIAADVVKSGAVHSVNTCVVGSSDPCNVPAAPALAIVGPNLSPYTNELSSLL